MISNLRLTNSGDDRHMSSYIRPKVPGASVFFTVNLADRGARTLVEHVDVLREAVRVTKAERPFRIDAWVVLPDHMHAVWTLPEGDTDYSVRMAAIKARFTRALTGADRRVGFHPTVLEESPAGSRVVGVGGGVEPHPTVNGRPRTKSKMEKGDGRVWQRRFWERHIRSDEEFAAAVRYCWINPVKHGLADHPDAWPHSSWHRDGGGDLMS
jgi:putative transposase